MVTYASRRARVSWFNAETRVDLGVLLGHARILGTPLKLPGEFSCRRPSLLHGGHTQMQVEFIALTAGPGRVRLPTPRWYRRAICPSSPINLRHPQCAAHLQP